MVYVAKSSMSHKSTVKPFPLMAQISLNKERLRKNLLPFVIRCPEVCVADVKSPGSSGLPRSNGASMTSQISFSKKINDLTNIFFQKNQWPHKYLFPKKSMTSQVSFFRKNQWTHKYFFAKKINDLTNIFLSFSKKSITS